MSHFLVYVRRSYRPSGAPDISDEAQVEAAVAMLPAGATHEVIADSGGHHSGRNDRRDGYQELIRRVEAGGLGGLAVYDLSRLARNAQLMHNLKAALDRRNVPLLVANMPTSRWDTAVGRFMFGQIVLAAQFQADLDSERMTGLARAAFEDGRHRGLPPFGYRNGKDDRNRRTLVVDPDEAAVVRRVFGLLADHAFAEVARIVTAEGHRMSRDTVKDLARRGRVYLGLVVARRGLEERPGQHEPIIAEAQWTAAIAGIRSRTRAGQRPRPHRVYLLSGVLFCRCGARMNGEARVSRGQEWRYYLCRACDAPSVPADAAEAQVLARLAELPPMTRRTIERGDEEWRRRVARPAAGLAAKRRAQLEGRLVNLRKQHEWGDLADADYRQAVADTRYELARLPDPDKVVAFDHGRRLIASIGALIDRGGPLQHQRLVRAIVERAQADDRRVVEVKFTPAVLAALAWLVRPRTASPTRHTKRPDAPQVEV